MSNLSGTKDRLKLAGNPVAYGKTWGAGDWAGNSLRALRTSYMIMATAYLLQEVIKGIISGVGKIRKGKETGNGKGRKRRAHVLKLREVNVKAAAVVAATAVAAVVWLQQAGGS